MTRDGASVRESALYPIVEQWLSTSRFKCFASGIEVGLKYGRVDVVGISDNGHDLSAHEELIAIEVKPSPTRFAASVGQAYGYGVYADRCYLACDLRTSQRTEFTPEEREIATQVGVGLLSIGARGAVTEELPSKLHTPIDGLRLEMIDRLNYSLCAVCRSLFRSGTADPRSKYSQVVRLTGRSSRSTVARAVDEGKGVMYWLSEASERDPRKRALEYRRRFLCADCLWALHRE